MTSVLETAGRAPGAILSKMMGAINYTISMPGIEYGLADAALNYAVSLVGGVVWQPISSVVGSTGASFLVNALRSASDLGLKKEYLVGA